MTRQALLVAVAVILALAALAPAALGAPAKPYDFNGDGRQELVVTMPQWGAGDGTTGANIVVRSGRKGLRRSAQVVSLDTPGIKRFPGRGHGLGGGAASGDFDGDGYADLAMAGYPGIVVVFGSAHGLDAHRSQTWSEPHTRFHDPAAGDVNGDGFADLAVVTQETRTDREQKDLNVALIRGGAGGLRPTRSETLDALGALRIADLDRDGHPELAYAYFFRLGVCRGTATGPHDCTSLPTQGFEKSLAVGDVVADGDRELVVGEPTVGNGGTVEVYRLNDTGVRRELRFNQGTRGIPGSDERGDEFGRAVEAGRIGRGGKAEIVVGAPEEDSARGRVTTVHMSRFGLVRRGNRTVHMDTRGVPGKSQRGASFGFALTMLDHNGDRRLELDASAPAWQGSSGLVLDFPAVRSGLRVRRTRAFTLENLGLFGDLRFGAIMGLR